MSVWITHYGPREGAGSITVYETEIDALRAAVGTGQEVIEVEYGQSLGDAIQAQYKRQPETGPDQGAG